MTELTRQAIQIRDARPDELEAISDVIRSAYQQYQKDYPPESWPRWIEMIGDVSGHSKKAEIIVADREGQVVGTVTFYADAALSGQGDWPAGSAAFVRLAVRPGSRGGGIGRALTQECIRRARERGMATIALHTTEWMEVARAMYERMGFVRDESFDFHTRTGIVGMGYRLELSQIDAPRKAAIDSP